MRGDVTATPPLPFRGRRRSRRDGRDGLYTSDRMFRQAVMGRLSARRAGDGTGGHEKGPLARPFPGWIGNRETGAYGFFFGLTAGAAAALSVGAAAVWVL